MLASVEEALTRAEQHQIPEEEDEEEGEEEGEEEDEAGGEDDEGEEKDESERPATRYDKRHRGQPSPCTNARK